MKAYSVQWRINRRISQTTVIPEFAGAVTIVTENVRNLRRQAGPPTGVAAALSRSDCTGRVALAELQGNSFTLTPERVKESSKLKNQNPSCSRSRGGMRGWPVHRPTHAPATALRTNGNSAPPTKPKTPRAVTLWRHACLTTPVVKPSLLQIPSAQMATTPKPSSFRNLRRKAGWPSHRSSRGILSHPLMRWHDAE